MKVAIIKTDEDGTKIKAHHSEVVITTRDCHLYASQDHPYADQRYVDLESTKRDAPKNKLRNGGYLLLAYVYEGRRRQSTTGSS